MSNSLHLSVMIGPIAPIPVPAMMIDALDSVSVTHAAGSTSAIQLSFKVNSKSELNTIFLIAVVLVVVSLIGFRRRDLL